MWSANVTVQWEIFKGENFCGFHRSEQSHKNLIHENFNICQYGTGQPPLKISPLQVAKNLPLETFPVYNISQH